MTKEVIIETDIPRESGYLYFVGTDENGNINVCKTEMMRGGKKKKK